ncbi:MAG: alanine--tRNA ligase [Bdellovibrionales bacterium]|nr:alanine--tRNA ligase [Bdellovibrionales bacterium]
MKSHEVRQKFIDYFAQHGHQPVPSSRLIPEGDPTLLFTNAGMNQFKNVFVGLEQRPYTRAVSAQKCVRAGGKHNDLENVGHTARHHTFFEMLGNFSFGDYFKKESIHFGWELITKVYGIDKDRLYVSVFQDDDEAADIWHKQEGVSKDRIYRFGEKDNFWRMGDAGPCGPCSEIFYDLGPDVPGDPKENVMGGNGDRFMEIWNHVFMQFEEDGKGGRVKLPRPSVDTGAGLERMTAVLQGKLSNYDTDLFQDLIQVAARLSKQEYVASLKGLPRDAAMAQDRVNVAMRVLADHARATGFLIADGVLPSNEGRGYVLRRIMRRAIRYGRQLSEDQSILPAVVAQVIEKMGGFYGELKQQRTLIERTVVDEEKRFLSTLDTGTQVLTQEMSRLASGGTLPGEVLFKLYDTYGFPVDLTRLMAQEKGHAIDELGFERLLKQAKEKARASWKGKNISGDQAFLVQYTQQLQRQNGDTKFTGYETSQETQVKLQALSDGRKDVTELHNDQTGVIITDKTCFYAESGGQVGDKGVIRSPSGEAEVLDTTKLNGTFLHHVRVTDGVIRLTDPVQLVVNSFERRNTANNHSATHLMHSALRQVLGTHVQQAGSLVEADRLRFDFTHNQPLTVAETEEIENLVNAEIGKGVQVHSEVMTHKAALDRGAMALFGEKYGDEVRVIQMGEFSMELCGGTHVSNTAQIRFFKIVSESGVSAGVRRIEAITGEKAAEYLNALSREALQARAQAGITLNWQKYLEGEGGRLPDVIASAQDNAKVLQREIQSLKGKNVDVDSLVSSATAFSVAGVNGRFVFADIPMDDRKVLSDLSDRLQDKLKDAVIVIVGQGDTTHPLIVSVSKSLTPKLNAGKILGEVAAALGGKGGGRPDFAQGAVPSRNELDQARQKVLAVIGH